MRKIIYPLILLFVSSQIVSCKSGELLAATTITLGAALGAASVLMDTTDHCHHSCNHSCCHYH